MPPTKKRCPPGTRRDKKTGECLPKPTGTANASSSSSQDKTKKKRCPPGTRRDKKTGECLPKGGPKPGPRPFSESVPSSPRSSSNKTKKKRCPPGSRRDKKTGECVPTRRRTRKKTPPRTPPRTPRNSTPRNSDDRVDAIDVFKMLMDKEHNKLKSIPLSSLCKNDTDDIFEFDFADHRQQESLLTLSASQCLDNDMFEKLLTCLNRNGFLTTIVLLYRNIKGHNFFDILLNLYTNTNQENDLITIANLMHSSYGLCLKLEQINGLNKHTLVNQLFKVGDIYKLMRNYTPEKKQIINDKFLNFTSFTEDERKSSRASSSNRSSYRSSNRSSYIPSNRSSRQSRVPSYEEFERENTGNFDEDKYEKEANEEIKNKLPNAEQRVFYNLTLLNTPLFNFQNIKDIGDLGTLWKKTVLNIHPDKVKVGSDFKRLNNIVNDNDNKNKYLLELYKVYNYLINRIKQDIGLLSDYNIYKNNDESLLTVLSNVPFMSNNFTKLYVKILDDMSKKDFNDLLFYKNKNGKNAFELIINNITKLNNSNPQMWANSVNNYGKILDVFIEKIDGNKNETIKNLFNGVNYDEIAPNLPTKVQVVLQKYMNS